MDVLGSGPELPPRARRGRPRRRPAALAGARPSRRLTAAVGVLLVAGAVAGLRAGIGPVEQPPAAGAPSETAGAPTGPAGPPYDRMPGRTPIPEPTPVGGGEVLRGPLPVVGSPGPTAARTAAELVLGRYCRRPARYAVALDRVERWRRVRALAVRLDRSTDPPWVVLDLAWTGRAYRWTGRAVQLGTC